MRVAASRGRQSGYLTTVYSKIPVLAMIVLMGADQLQADESEAFFRILLDSAPDAMIIVDDTGSIVLVNAQTEAMFGFARDEMLGKPIEMLLPESVRDTHIRHREQFVATPSVRPMGAGLELVGRDKDGREFPVEISLSPVATKTHTFVSSVIRDVSRRKKMEEEIIAAKQAAERANKANTAFLAAASHDLRQPVQALSLLNGALRRTVKDARALEMVESQERSLTAMTNLLNSLLDISRLDAGAISPEFEEFPMQRLIDRLAPEFGRQAKQKGLRFVARPCAALVRSDPNLLSEIIQNLVSNAIRYTEQGEVGMTCSPDGDHCRIEVRDTGIGIGDDQLENIFQEFHQIRSPGGNKEGFGLGLAIVRRLADLLGHDISVQSELGKGSCFAVSLPLVDAVPQAAEESADANPLAAGFESGTVILIEDDANVTNAWSLLLEAEGYRVVTAESAPEAHALIERLDEAPVLIVSDFHLLDGSTGVEAVATIREYFDRNIPAFIVSGDTTKVVNDARPVDNSTLMRKPVNTRRLLAAARIATRTGRVPAD